MLLWANTSLDLFPLHLEVIKTNLSFGARNNSNVADPVDGDHWSERITAVCVYLVDLWETMAHFMGGGAHALVMAGTVVSCHLGCGLPLSHRQ